MHGVVESSCIRWREFHHGDVSLRVSIDDVTDLVASMRDSICTEIFWVCNSEVFLSFLDRRISDISHKSEKDTPAIDQRSKFTCRIRLCQCVELFLLYPALKVDIMIIVGLSPDYLQIC